MGTLLYWLTNYAFDFMFYMGTAMIVLLPLQLVPYTMLDIDDYNLIFLLNLLHGYAALPFIYICSFLYSDPASAYSTLVILLFLITSAGCLGSVFMEHYVEDVSGASLVTAIEVALNLLRLLPSFSYSRGMMKIIQLARENDICQNGGLQLEGRCQTKEVKGRLSLMQCCMHKDSPDPSEYMIRPLDVNTYSAFYEFVTLSVEGLAAFVLLLCLESWIRKQDRALSALDSSAYEEGAVSLQRPSGAVAKNLVVDGKKDEDTDVALENKLVKALVNSQAPVSASRPFVIVNRLFKAYGYIECNPVLQGLTFTVRNGECFGLLGVNGAGKTTTFRVLTGEILPNYGDAIIANFSIVHDRKNCWHYMGYCPQRDGLLDMLTGVETVLFFGRLRGIPITNDYLSALLNIFRLQEIADYLVGTYSAGNRRKLSMCISMIGLPRIVLLDEPYAAISTTARRQIVNYVSALQKVSKMSILLSSHSLSDIEFLCNRIAIMDAGKLQCLGSLGKLKEKFGKGYTLTIKTYPDKRLDYAYQQDVTHDVCKAFQEAEVVYCYEGVLEFRMLRVHMLLSDMFLRMARIKHRHKLQDFYISDTSLEQIFKSVTRKEYVEAAAAAAAVAVDYQPPGTAPQVLASAMGL
ncbi:ATP-binding cassette sub-family A member 2-like [Rhipicephalus microplus]|uniref:ATP-binding cassette sub-family A member 2-like n=1 Tax=Rhipicephalus microplus TaxID=6941 RepID=UPI003F6D4C13